MYKTLKYVSYFFNHFKTIVGFKINGMIKKSHMDIMLKEIYVSAFVIIVIAGVILFKTGSKLFAPI